MQRTCFFGANAHLTIFALKGEIGIGKARCECSAIYFSQDNCYNSTTPSRLLQKSIGLGTTKTTASEIQLNWCQTKKDGKQAGKDEADTYLVFDKKN